MDSTSLAWEQVRLSRGAIVRAEQPAPAPAGVAEFCQRMPEACATSAQDGAANGWLQPVVLNAIPGVQPWIVRNQDAASIFAQLLAARAEGVRVEHQRREVALTEEVWRTLSAVNLEVNRSISASTDAQSYGRDEFWAMPLTEGRTAQGDCEDYALEKRARLIEQGWDRDALALAVADAPGVGMHAVLIVQTDHGDFVLDNLHDAPRSPRALNYRWVSRQAGASLASWASASVEAAPPRQLLFAAAAGARKPS